MTALNWSENPVQLILCEDCGEPDCNFGEYVHISVIGDLMLWSKPRVGENDFGERVVPIYIVEMYGAVLISKSTWDSWRNAVWQLPPFEKFPKTQRGDLGNAWFMQAPGRSRTASLHEVMPMLKGRLLGTETLDVAEALRHVASLVEWFSVAPSQEVQGTLGPPTGDTQVETLYFDGPAMDDWTAFGIIHGKTVPAFGKEWIYYPNAE